MIDVRLFLRACEVCTFISPLLANLPIGLPLRTCCRKTHRQRDDELEIGSPMGKQSGTGKQSDARVAKGDASRFYAALRYVALRYVRSIARNVALNCLEMCSTVLVGGEELGGTEGQVAGWRKKGNERVRTERVYSIKAHHLLIYHPIPIARRRTARACFALGDSSVRPGSVRSVRILFVFLRPLSSPPFHPTGPRDAFASSISFSRLRVCPW